MNKQDDKMKQFVSTVTNELNSFSFAKDDFCSKMEREHRYLQNEFTGLCLKWLETCASDDYQYDGRNESSHLIAKKLLEKDI